MFPMRSRIFFLFTLVMFCAFYPLIYKITSPTSAFLQRRLIKLIYFSQFEPANFLHPRRYCYIESNTTIIFLHLTNVSDEWTPLEMCAIKSAAIMNNDSGVCVLTQFPMQDHEALANLPNLEIADLNASHLFENTPLGGWYESYVLRDTKKKINIWELSDGLRFAYLYKYGGKYMDTDSWTLRNLVPLHNVAGWHDKNLIASGVLFFEKGHPLIQAILENFMKYFRPGIWGSVGPQLVTMIHKSGLVDNSTYTLLKPHIFYPTSYVQYRLPFLANQTKMVKLMIRGAYTLHLWRHMIQNYWQPGVLPPNGSFAFEFLNDICL